MFNALHKGGKVLAIAAAVAGLVAMVTLSGGAGARARDGVSAAVTSKIAVESRDGHVLAKIIIDNQSEQTVFVARSVMAASEPQGPLFDVRDSSNGDPLDYLGPMVKRAAPTKKDFVAIKANSQLSNTVDIGNAYRYVLGRHAYQINFSGSYVTDVKKPEQQTPLEPASAMFAHVGR